MLKGLALLAAVTLLAPVFQLSTANFADGFESAAAPEPGQCAQTVSDDITRAATWTNGPAACDYLIVPRNTGDPIAPGRAPVAVSNGLLTIEPGTVIQFAEDGSLLISDGGGLQAVGTPEARIVFASQQPVAGFGRGIHFSSNALDSRIEYADFINLGEEVSLGGPDAAIDAAANANPRLTLRYTTISGSSTSGAFLEEFTLLGFTDNRFFNNAQFGLRVSGPQLGGLDSASDYSGGAQPNGLPYIAVEGVSPRHRVQSNATWKNLNAPYYIDIALNIESGQVTLEPGVRFVSGPGGTLRVSEAGALTAVGTAAQPITFVGEQPQPGYWDGIVFFESDSINNRFDYVEVRHGGEGSADAAIDLSLDAYLSLSNSTVSDSASAGVCVGFRSTLDQGSGNTFSNNPDGDIIFDC